MNIGEVSRRHFLRSTAAALAIAPGGIAFAQAPTGAPILIGAGMGLTGAIAASGLQFRHGIEVASDLTNAEGGVHGRPVQVLFEDTLFEATQSVNAFRKLVDVEKVSAAIFGGSSPLAAIAPLATQEKVFVVNLGAQSPSLAGISPYVFHAIQLANYDIEVIAKYVYETLGLHTMALMYVNNDTGVSNRQYMQQYFTKLGGTIVESEAFNENDVNFGAQIARVRAANPSVIYMSGTTAEHPFLVKQLRDADVNAQLISYVAVETPEMLKIAGKDAEGLIYTSSHFDVASTDPYTKKFVEAFRAKYKMDPQTRDAVGFDSLELIVDVMRQAPPNATGEDLRNVAMKVRKFPGVTGDIVFRDDGTVAKTIDLRTIKNGKFVFLKAIEPTN